MDNPEVLENQEPTGRLALQDNLAMQDRMVLQANLGPLASQARMDRRAKESRDPKDQMDHQESQEVLGRKAKEVRRERQDLKDPQGSRASQEQLEKQVGLEKPVDQDSQEPMRRIVLALRGLLCSSTATKGSSSVWAEEFKENKSYAFHWGPIAICLIHSTFTIRRVFSF